MISWLSMKGAAFAGTTPSFETPLRATLRTTF
jgi:hypothetical protein